MNKNIKVANKLVKIAESLMNDNSEFMNDDSGLPNEVKKILPGIKDEKAKREIIMMFSSKRKVAFDFNNSDWNEQVKKIKMWMNQHIIGFNQTAILLKVLYEEKTGQKLQSFAVQMLEKFLSLS